MQIVSVQSDRAQVITDSGVTLTCVGVRQMPVQKMLFDMGLADMTPENASSTLANMPPEQQTRTTRAALALFNYAMGYGIVESPPPEAVAELRELGLTFTSQAALRAAWLNYFVLSDAAEAGELVGVILRLTFQQGG